MKHNIVQGFLVVMMLAALSSQVHAQDYYGGELFSKSAVKYGKFEARMRMVEGSGIVSSLFTYYNDSYMGAPEPWREVDIEVLGKNPDQFQSNVITGTASSRITSEKHHDVPGGAAAAYNTYALEWTPDYLAWFINGVEVRRDEGQQVTDLQDKEQNLRFNLWIANIVSWVGPFDDAILPRHQFINWVQYSEYTPGEGTDGGDFTLSWRDDFDTFDSQRWGKGNWTFAENEATFSTQNIGVKDGILVIALTTADGRGIDVEVPADGESTSSLIPSSLNQEKRVRWNASLRQVSLENNVLNEAVSVELLDLNGRTLAQLSPEHAHIQGNVMSWTVNDFSAGVKIFRVRNNNGEAFSTLIADM